ncbi:MAG: electron transfer flavoprotein subunit alpha, partial [Desulfuromonadales bacterium]|nr:electron transfer flavoprotein subunit alpha [Desulfuromonadales bacterium]
MWVLIEHRGGEFEEASLEVLTEARRLANKAKLGVSALILGDQGLPAAEALSQYGADTVCVVEHELLDAYTTDGYTTVLAGLLREKAPGTLLMAGSALGRDLAPRLAARLGTSVVSDCTVLEINAEGTLEMTRPSCGGRVYTTFT